MVPLYALLTLVVAALKGLLSARAARVERKYAKAAKEAEAVARAVQAKPTTGAVDPYAVAKSQYELGRLVEKRDDLEAKTLAWQARAEKAAVVLAKLRGLNGRLVPYLMGVVDVGLVLVVLSTLGLPHGLTAEGVQVWAKSFGG
jgi:hypothetical protein